MSGNFKEDLQFGKIFEQQVAEKLSSYGFKAENIEGYNKGKDIVVPIRIKVKSDRMINKTGNYAIEYRCRGELSGIMTTTAHYWVICNDQRKYLVPVKQLHAKLRKLKEINKLIYKISSDDNKSEMALVPRQYIECYFCF